MKILVFGAGVYGKACKVYIERQEQNEFIGFVDNNAKNISIKGPNGEETPIYHPEKLNGLQYDQILISNSRPSQIAEIEQQLKGLQVPSEKVQVLCNAPDFMMEVLVNYNQYDEFTDRRVSWLRNFAEYAKEEQFRGNVAECGVCMGEFSFFINKYFPDRTLYLFDTFEGFSEQDLKVERKFNEDAFINSIFNDQQCFSGANEQVVLGRMLHPEKCILKKGYFPQTAADVKDQFCFVNLDMDLYQPMLAGLRFFYEKMCKDGIILLHDYFHPKLPGVKRAVKDFEAEKGLDLKKFPIGDFCSIAVIR